MYLGRDRKPVQTTEPPGEGNPSPNGVANISKPRISADIGSGHKAEEDGLVTSRYDFEQREWVRVDPEAKRGNGVYAREPRRESWEFEDNPDHRRYSLGPVRPNR